MKPVAQADGLGDAVNQYEQVSATQRLRHTG